MIIDFLFAAFAIYGFYIGYSKGIIKSIVSILSIAVGIVAALRFSPVVTDMLKETFDSQSPLMFIAGLILTFLLTMTLLRVMGKGLEGILKTANINFINQLLGGAFMAAALIFLYSSALWFVVQVGRMDETSVGISESQTYSFLKTYPGKVTRSFSMLKPVLQDFWDYTMDMMDQVDQMTEKPEEDTQIYDLPEEEYDATKE
ncbi:MAG: CvpA family protein [Haliscomenobacter sp.]